MAVTDLNLKRHSTPINRNAARERLLVSFFFLSRGFLSSAQSLIYAHPDLQSHENMMASLPFLFFVLALTEIV